MRPLEPIVGRKVDDNPGIPRPIQDRSDSAVESAVDETAGVQIPLVLQLFEYRGEQILRDSFADLHRYSLPFLRSPNNRTWAFPGGPCDEWILWYRRMDRVGARDGRLQDARRDFLGEGVSLSGGVWGMEIQDEEKMEESASEFSRSHLVHIRFDTQASVCPNPCSNFKKLPDDVSDVIFPLTQP